MQLKREAKLLTVIGLNTKHADCRIIFMLYPIRIIFMLHPIHTKKNVNIPALKYYITCFYICLCKRDITSESGISYYETPCISKSMANILLMYNDVHISLYMYISSHSVLRKSLPFFTLMFIYSFTTLRDPGRPFFIIY